MVSVTSYAFTAATLVCAAMAAAIPEPQGLAGTINGHQNAIDHYRAQLANGNNPNAVAPLAPRPAPTNNAQRVVDAINDRDFQTDKAIAYVGAHTGPVGHAVADVLLSPPVQAASTGLQYVVGSTIGGAEDLVQGMVRGGQRLAANRQH